MKNKKSKPIRKSVTKQNRLEKIKPHISKPIRKPVTKQKSLENKPQKIVETDCVMWLGKKSLQIKYNDSLYLTSIEIVESKIKEDTAHISLGLMTKDGIENDVGAWLTKKGNAIYFSPSKNVLLVTSVSSLQRVLAGELDKSSLGIFQ